MLILFGLFSSCCMQWAIDSDQPVKIDKWDCNAVKNSLDDAAKKVTAPCINKNNIFPTLV